MNILALDLGTKTGYAHNRGGQFFAGTWTLASAKEVTAWGKVRLNRRNDPRIDRLCEMISGLGNDAFDAIVFEDCQFITTTYAGQLWAGLRSAIWLCGIAKHFDCVPVATLKKFATGNGGATKGAMAQSLFRAKQCPHWPNFPKLDDNGVDACWLWIWAQQNLQRIAPSTTIIQ